MLIYMELKYFDLDLVAEVLHHNSTFSIPILDTLLQFKMDAKKAIHDRCDARLSKADCLSQRTSAAKARNVELDDMAKEFQDVVNTFWVKH